MKIPEYWGTDLFATFVTMLTHTNTTIMDNIYFKDKYEKCTNAYIVLTYMKLCNTFHLYGNTINIGYQ